MTDRYISYKIYEEMVKESEQKYSNTVSNVYTPRRPTVNQTYHDFTNENEGNSNLSNEENLPQNTTVNQKDDNSQLGVMVMLTIAIFVFIMVTNI